jgi:hypothetical protein
VHNGFRGDGEGATRGSHPGGFRDARSDEYNHRVNMSFEPERLRPPESFARLLCATALIALLSAAVAYLSPHVPVTLGLARAIAIVWVIGSALATAWFAPSRGERRLLWFMALAALYALLFSLQLGALTPGTMFIVTLAVLTTGALVGGYIGSLLEYPGMLLVVAYVAAIADSFSVFHPSGLTAKVLANPRALALLTIPFPVLGTRQISSMVGIGDVVFASLFVAGARTTGLDPRRTVAAMGVALVAIAIVVELVRAPLPALPFLSAAVVLVHPEARKLPVEHTRRITANLVVVTLVLGLLFVSATLHLH